MNTNKLLLIVLFLLVLTGCQPTCKDPYIEFKKGDCCLDSDKNAICDNDETQLKSNMEAQSQIVVKAPDKEDCKYECCINSEFKTKLCNEGYECKNFKCEIVDTDGDGLSDLDEKVLRTNVKLLDTDGDTLSDFEEVKSLKTNPTNKNTDGDRNNDNIDKEPLIKNSANIELSSEEILPSIGELTALIDDFKNKPAQTIEKFFLDLIENAGTKDLIVVVKNSGDDYSEGVSFEIETHVIFTKKERDGLSCVNEKVLGESKIGTQSFSFDENIKIGQEIKKTIILNVIQVPQTVIPKECEGFQYCSCAQKISYAFNNIKYEEFT